MPKQDEPAPTDSDYYASLSLLEVAEHSHEGYTSFAMYLEETRSNFEDDSVQIVLKAFETARDRVNLMLPRAFERAKIFMPSAVQEDVDEISKYRKIVNLYATPAESLIDVEPEDETDL